MTVLIKDIISGITVCYRIIGLNGPRSHEMTNSATQSAWSGVPPPRVNSPNCPVSSGADRPQRRVSLRDVPRRFLDLQSVKTRSDGGVLHRRLHGAVFFEFPVISLFFYYSVVLSTWQVRSGSQGKSRARKRPRFCTASPAPPNRHMMVGCHAFRLTAVKTCGHTIRPVLWRKEYWEIKCDTIIPVLEGN